jgi:uncharacterized protein DUF2442
MGILALAADERVANVNIDEDELSVRLRDGRTISVPLAWYPRLLHATRAQRNNWKIAGAGYGIYWEEIDEDLSAEGLLRGAPAARRSITMTEPGKRPEVSVSPESETVETRVDSAEEVDDEVDKGILDHLIEGEEAASELVKVLSWIESETNGFTSKINKHTSNLDRLLKNPGGSTARDYKNVVLLTASDMNTFSHRVEEVIPKFEKSTKTLDQSYSVYVGFAKPKSPDDIERIDSLRQSLSQLLEVIKPAKENITSFRDSTLLIKNQNMSKELNRAAERQAKTLDSVLSETERVESFALRINFLIDERFGQSPATEDS